MGFTRKQAKELLSLSEETLEELGLITNKSIIEHYVNGGDVELCHYVLKEGPEIVERPDFYGSKGVYYWRITEPPEIELFGVKVRCNPPMSDFGDYGDEYLFLDPSSRYGYSATYFNNYKIDYIRLERGICWPRSQEKDIQKAAKALFKDLQ